MGATNTTCCCNKEEQPDEEGVIKDLSLVTLDEDADESLVDALTELQDAVRLFHAGSCTEATTKLTLAEFRATASPKSVGKTHILSAILHDPNIQELRQRRSSSITTSELPDAPTVDVSIEGPVDKSVEPSATPKTANQSKLAALEASLTEVRNLCHSAQLFKAHDALERLQGEVVAAHKDMTLSNDDGFKTGLANFTNKLQADPIFEKLHPIHERAKKALALLTSPYDDRGVRLELKDPQIGEAFCCDCKIRFAEGAERIKKGPATQVILRAEVKNYPASLMKVIVENCEADLFRAEWMKDCKAYVGAPGRPSWLYRVLMHVSVSPPLLPIKIDDVLFRDFVVCCGEGVLPDRGPGVIVIEHRPPEGLTEFEGMAIPPKKRGIIRVTGGMTAYYKARSKLPGCSDWTVVSTMGLPVPQAMLPLWILKRFAADFLMNSLRLLKKNLYDKWVDLPYQGRIASMPQLYEVVAEVAEEKMNPR